MTCPTPVINITNSEAERETTEPIVGESGDENTITVKGKCLNCERSFFGNKQVCHRKIEINSGQIWK